MLGLLSALAKAVVAAPVAVVADVVTLPATALNNKDPFGNTSKVLGDIVKEL